MGVISFGENMKYQIFSDGGCRGNKRGTENIGAWAYAVFDNSGSQLSHQTGIAYNTTNSQMELMAAIRALESLEAPSKVQMNVDSQYVLKGITAWLRGWKRNGWKTANKKPVANQDLWQKLDDLNQKHDIQWVWVKGHSNSDGNNLVDKLLNEAMDAVS